MNRLIRCALLSGITLLTPAAHADGAGTLNDSALTLSYAGGPAIAPNPLVLTSTAPPTQCQLGNPACDIYTLTVDLSDAFRADPVNDRLLVEIQVAFEGDWDVWMLDANGDEVAQAAGTDNPERIAIPLKQLANGVYTLELTPFFPETTGFELTVNAAGSKSADAAKSSSLLAGGFGLAGLLGLLALAALRRK